MVWETVWEIRSICSLMAFKDSVCFLVSSLMISDCFALSSDTSITSCIFSVTLIAIFLPSFTASIESLIRAVVFFTASALLWASVLTSLATTAKPLPACPALAASTEAFKARILVWKAMSSISLAIFVICWALSLMSSIAEDRAAICSLAL